MNTIGKATVILFVLSQLFVCMMIITWGKLIEFSQSEFYYRNKWIVEVIQDYIYFIFN